MAVQCSIGGTYLSSYPANNMPNTNSAITLMGWVNYNSWTTTTVASMFGMYNGTPTTTTVPTTAIQIGARTNAGAIFVWTWGGNALVNTTAGTPTLTNGNWYHIAYTCTAISGGNQTHSIYVNGTLSATATNAVQVAGTLTQMYINGFPQTAGGTSESSGTIVEGVSVYNRVLSADEINTIYNCRGNRDGVVYGLVSRHLVQEINTGNITSCVDYSGSNSPLSSGAGTALTYAIGTCYHNTRPQI